MKKSIVITGLGFFVLVVTLNSCKNEEVPDLTTFNNSAWYRSLNTFESVLGRNYYLKRVGYSVRCVMD